MCWMPIELRMVSHAYLRICVLNFVGYYKVGLIVDPSLLNQEKIVINCVQN